MNMATKKLMSILISLVLICSAGVVFAGASGLEGNGTADDPYIVGNAAELDALSSLTAGGNSFYGKYVSLESDITVSGSFSPIGSAAAPFKGNFDGNGFTVSGFDLDCDYAGLFGYTENATITDVNVSGTFFATDYAGSIVAYAKNTVISDCVSSAAVYSFNFTGGIAGYINGGSITDCSTTAQAVVAGYEENCGGIAGFSKAEISNCVNNAYVRGNKNVGGIAGTSEGSVISCTNTVAVTVSESAAGGIVGFAKGTIRYCKNTGRISANSSAVGKIGGIAGVCSAAAISECLQTGAVSATGEYAGGIAGYLTNGSISDCVSTGAVSTSSDFAGGIFGSTSKTAVSRCVFTSGVTSNSGKVAAIGAISGGTVTDCYYDSSKMAKAFVSAVSSTGATGVTSSAISESKTYKNWNFTSVWEMNSLHASYPLLRNIPFHTLTEYSSTPVSCTSDGLTVYLCSLCHETVEVTTPATGHKMETVSEKHPSCSVAGYKDTACENCTYTHSEDIPALGHKDTDGDSKCDLCKASITEQKTDSEKSIFEKIADFFRQIIDWFNSLFNK